MILSLIKQSIFRYIFSFYFSAPCLVLSAATDIFTNRIANSTPALKGRHSSQKDMILSNSPSSSRFSERVGETWKSWMKCFRESSMAMQRWLEEPQDSLMSLRPSSRIFGCRSPQSCLSFWVDYSQQLTILENSAISLILPTLLKSCPTYGAGLCPCSCPPLYIEKNEPVRTRFSVFPGAAKRLFAASESFLLSESYQMESVLDCGAPIEACRKARWVAFSCLGSGVAAGMGIFCSSLPLLLLASWVLAGALSAGLGYFGACFFSSLIAPSGSAPAPPSALP
ncbi:hypothetical protein FGO68_gene1487 [Halteria grandinella]|uniref:Transmembrane protein n=1 Tax=Halteria grandinella TaxID=5974 RepID=A0A8J8NUL9_HALGN|nr:hypothetical protein FGO68_gene1487 [Halteria grandinella]